MNSINKKNPRLMKRSLGTWISIGSPIISEMASMFNFDWLLFDLEHGAFTEAALLNNLQSASAGKAALIVRVGSLDPSLISRVLDWGASGIMVPHVTTKEKAIECVKAMQYPPKGIRGFSQSVRTYGYGLGLDTEIEKRETPMFFAQIEDTEGVKNVDEIAAVPGVDILFVGPRDLKLSLSFQDKSTFIKYEQALELISQAALSHQKKAGILIREEADLIDLMQMGFSCFAINSDMSILKHGFQTICEKFAHMR